MDNRAKETIDLLDLSTNPMTVENPSERIERWFGWFGW